MKHITPVHIFKSGRSIFVLLAVLLLFSAVCPQNGHAGKLLAEGGIFDLRQLRLSAGETLSLDGEWEFYWDRLLTPADFEEGKPQPEMDGYFPMHRSWTRFELDGKKLGGTGQASFRLRMMPGQDLERLHIRLFDIHEAYRFWADGKLIAQCGIPGSSAQEEFPGRSLELAEINFYGKPVELILQVSNYHFRTGGVPEPIMVAHPGTLEHKRARDWGLALFFAGCMLIMAIYHLVLYLFRKRDPAPLYFSIYCLLVVGYSVTSNTSQWVASAILPWWNPQVMEYFSLACFVIWPSLLFRFLETLYPEEFHHKLLYFLDGRIGVFFLLLIFVPGLPLYWFIAICLLQIMIYSGYYLHRLALCIKRGRKGAQFLIAGLAAQFMVGWNDALTHTGIIKSIYLAEPAVCFFVLTQSLAMAQRFSASFDSVERLSKELEIKNISLHDEMNERNRLEQKVVNISEEERRRISHELHDGLCQQLTGARLRSSALAHKHRDLEDAQALRELADLLKESTDDAYKTARGLWPVEHGASMPGPSLETLVRDIRAATGIDIVFSLKSHCVKCTNTNITTLYRIAQEALINAAKHSGAAKILVELESTGDGRVKLQVKDNGIGRSAAGSPDGGLGMSIMAHRAKLINADLRIEDGPQGGTIVTCVAPCSVLKISNDVGNQL
ncbi:sensor histidine kinase [Maridesulfovibrio sp.]|uniref:sensor histidine kinase n=1 Tax=Maridesulfovibrio sp. TaxID=2795000 RepID=UPI002A187A79|nr:sensor histidine kinase [Maridesulfovibrio sp.]